MHALLLELTALLSFWLCIGAWQEEGAASGRRAFVCLCLAVFSWAVGSLALIEGLVTLRVAQRIAAIGVLAVPTLWFGLGLLAAQHPLARHRRWLLPGDRGAADPALRDALRGASRRTSCTTRQGPRTTLGPGGWVNAVYSWLLSAAGSWLFLLGATRLREQRGPRLLVCAASLAPLLGSIAWRVRSHERHRPDAAVAVPGADPAALRALQRRLAARAGDPGARPGEADPAPAGVHRRGGRGRGPESRRRGAACACTPPTRRAARSKRCSQSPQPNGDCARWPIRVGDALAGYAVQLADVPQPARARRSMRVLSLPLGLCILLATALAHGRLAAGRRRRAAASPSCCCASRVCLSALGELSDLPRCRRRGGRRSHQVRRHPDPAAAVARLHDAAGGPRAGAPRAVVPGHAAHPGGLRVPADVEHGYGSLFWMPVAGGDDLYGPLWVVIEHLQPRAAA